MFSSSDIKNVVFSTGFKGYKQDEIDDFLDKIFNDYIEFERIINNYTEQIDELKAKNESLESAQAGIQTVLLNAQKLADQIVNEAKEKSEEIILRAEANINVITNKEKELADAFEEKASERKLNLQTELNEMIQKAELKAKSINQACEDSVRRQQVLFDKLKLEIGNFKTNITSKYKEHLSILQDIPDSVDIDPLKASELISAKIEMEPNIDNFISSNNISENSTVSVDNKTSFGFEVKENFEENQ